jgi:ribosomal protein L32E
MTHTWRFFRSSGFDQVIIDSVEDLQNLATLDKKLWTALACPTKGLELDPRMLKLY